jgi:hypothetical protein
MIRKCPICSKPYEVYNMYAGDQSTCAACRRETQRRVTQPTPDEERRYDERRCDYFGDRRGR